ncbi:MAG: AAA family ATPase, partial [Pygmaiobacter sp.]
MPTVSFKLLQSPSILLDGKPVTLPFKKAEALLYCLVLKKKLSREQAATLLWDSDDTQIAKKNLRHTLYTIKKVLDLELIVSPQKQLLSLNPDIELDVDYDRFMETGDFNLYQGELLQGFDVKNADAFENWLAMERTALKDHYLRGLYDCMVQTSDSDSSALEALFAKYIKEDPLDERVYLLLMQCYQKNKMYHKGIKVYQNLSRLLNSELRIAPCAELISLHRELLGSWTESSTAEPEPQQVKVIGRSKELQFLQKAYHSFLLGTPTSICIQGDNGVGKTHLVNHFLDSADGDACIILHTICFQAEHEFILQPWNAIMLQLDKYIRNKNIHLPANYTTHISNLFPLFGDHALTAQVPEDLMTSYNYRSTRNSILKLFALIGEESPIILFFDNLQFMDNLSLELLSLIIRDQSPNILCICTCLDVLPPQVQKQLNALVREKFLSQIVLGPLTEHDVSDIIAERLGADALSETIIKHIYQDSEGNGFYLDMLLSYLSLDATNDQVVPTNPQDILLERLEELSTDARQLLDTISVCPGYIPLEIVEFIFNR